MGELFNLVWNTWLLGGIFQALQYFYGWVHDYGFAIILLTLAFRVILIPVTWKQTKSMYELQEIQPKIKALQEKHKNDKEKQSEELMKFYQENKVNPFGGCLPLLAQMPLFIALFSVLRQNLPDYIKTLAPTAQAAAKHFWVILPDITMTPQHVYQVTSAVSTQTVATATSGASAVATSSVVAGSGGVMAGVGATFPYVIFVLLFGLSVWLPQYLMTKDPTQRKTGTYMAIMMLYFGFVSPAGVLIYWVTSSAWQVGQQVLTQRMLAKQKESAATAIPAVEPAKTKGKKKDTSAVTPAVEPAKTKGKKSASKAGKGKKAGS